MFLFKVLPSKKKFEWHKEIHDEKPKACPYCREKFVHTTSLTRHVRRVHDMRYVPKKEREGENVECPVCNQVFLKSSLNTHLKVGYFYYCGIVKFSHGGKGVN